MPKIGQNRREYGFVRFIDDSTLQMHKNKRRCVCIFFAVRTGLEPATPCVTGMYSNQLNYRTNSICRTFFSKAGAKVLLFFDMTKFFEKKVQFHMIFFTKSSFSSTKLHKKWRISAHTLHFRIVDFAYNALNVASKYS